jgi:hypothetical protein
VPCRLVGGYIGGDYNDLGGYYLVTEEKAHVWVEALIEGNGWVRIDPSSFAANAGDVLNVQRSLGLKQQITLVLDSFNHLWNRSVIAYDFEQQRNVANAVTSRLQGIESVNIFHIIVPYLLGVLTIAALCIIVRRLPHYRSREQRILKSFLRIMGDKFEISSGEGGVGLFEIASVADNSHVSAFVTLYADAVYHDRKLTDIEYAQLRLYIRLLQKVTAKKILTSKTISGY